MQKRLFIAISYDQNPVFAVMQQKIVTHLQTLLDENGCILALQDHVHNTLFFLGARSVDEIPKILDECTFDIEKHIKKYGFGSLKTYTSRINFQILGHGVIAAIFEHNEMLSHLYTLFEHSFGGQVGKEKRTFLPHVTLARIKRITKSNYDKVIKDASVILNELNEEFQESFVLGTDSLILFSSDQAKYSEIAKFEI